MALLLMSQTGTSDVPATMPYRSRSSLPRCAYAWFMRAADAIFPKQQAKTALPPVSPVLGRTKRHKQGLKHTLLTAAPACTLEIPKQKSEEEVWNAIRRGAPPGSMESGSAEIASLVHMWHADDFTKRHICAAESCLVKFKCGSPVALTLFRIMHAQAQHMY